MKNVKKISAFLIIPAVLLFTCCKPKSVGENKTSWGMGNIIQLHNVDQVMLKESTSLFHCPAIEKDIAWESGGIFNPFAIVYNDSIVLLYCAEDNSSNDDGRKTSRIGYAISSDGIDFKKEKVPVLFPDKDEQAEHEWLGGCQDPRISMTEDGTYIMFYTQWNRHYPRLAVASSTDLKNWTKHGPVFKKAYNGKYYNTPSKSASIVTSIKNGKQTIEKIDGQYYLYWGDNHIFGAVSDNLYDWYPLEDENGELKKIISPRNGYFDSDKLSCGPSAVLTETGILFFYNGENKAGEFGSRDYPDLMVASGQALFDKNRPEKLIERLDKPFVYTLSDSLSIHNYLSMQSFLYFNNQWYLYFDTDSSEIEVAVYDLDFI